MNYFFTAQHLNLYRSLDRYFRYVLNEKLTLLTEKSAIPEDNSKIYVLDTEKYDDRFLKIISEMHKYHLILLGINEGDPIDLIHATCLRNEITRVLASDPPVEVYKPDELKDKLKLLFRGHGEQTLLGCLGGVYYYLWNYSQMAKTGSWPTEGLNERFLMPGEKNWMEFTRRFTKYAPILSLAGYSEEEKNIKRNLNQFNLYLLKTKEANSLYIFNSETLQSLQEIITFLEKMASEIDRKQDETNPADHR